MSSGKLKHSLCTCKLFGAGPPPPWARDIAHQSVQVEPRQARDGELSCTDVLMKPPRNAELYRCAYAATEERKALEK